MDINILVAALLRNGAARRLLFGIPCALVTVSATESKIFAMQDEVCARADMTPAGYHELFERIMHKMDVAQDFSYWPWMPKARRLLGHIDVEDVPFLALALSKKMPIWTDDKHFLRQSEVQVITTADMVRLFEKQ